MGLGVPLVPLGVPRLDLVDECGLRRDTAPKALTTHMAACDLRHVEPTAVFGSRVNLSFLRESFRLRGIKGFLERCCGMGMQIVHHEADVLHMGIMVIHQCLDKVRPIHLGPRRSDFGLPLTSSGCKTHTNIGRAISLRFSGISQWLARLSGERGTDCTNQLGRHCIQTPLRALRLIRFFVDLSDFFHVADEGGILRWRHTPCFLLPRLKCVFLHVRRTVSWDTASTISKPPLYQHACVRSTAHDLQELGYHSGRSNGLLHLR